MIEPIEINVRITLASKSPFVMHNPAELADPDSERKQAIDEIVAKGKLMTPEDRKRKDELHWRGALYTEMVKEGDDPEPQERLIIPMAMLARAIEDGGKTLGSGTSSKGAAVVRSVTPTETYMVLDYDGPRDIAELQADSRFRWRTLVNPNPSARKGGKLPSVRPILPVWGAVTTLNLVTDMGLSWQDFERAARAAGQIGIGDARKLGYGRFNAKLTKLR